MKRVLFVGESWHVHVTEAKGFDTFTDLFQLDFAVKTIRVNAPSQSPDLFKQLAIIRNV